MKLQRFKNGIFMRYFFRFHQPVGFHPPPFFATRRSRRSFSRYLTELSFDRRDSFLLADSTAATFHLSTTDVHRLPALPKQQVNMARWAGQFRSLKLQNRWITSNCRETAFCFTLILDADRSASGEREEKLLFL